MLFDTLLGRDRHQNNKFDARRTEDEGMNGDMETAKCGLILDGIALPESCDNKFDIGGVAKLALR